MTHKIPWFWRQIFHNNHLNLTFHFLSLKEKQTQLTITIRIIENEKLKNDFVFFSFQILHHEATRRRRIKTKIERETEKKIK